MLLNNNFVLLKQFIGYIPIVEPEIDINADDKEQIEKVLKEKINEQLSMLDNDIRIILKLTIPTIPNFYEDYTKHKNVLKVVALSGGYDREKACQLLSKNTNVSASFSRALLQDLKENMTDKEFNETLKNNIEEIYNASII